MRGSRLQAVGEEDVLPLIGAMEVPAEASPHQEKNATQEAFTNLLMMSLKALSQRAIVALASLVDLALLASVFALLLMVISEPTTLQLVAVAGYGIFTLCALFMRRRNA